MRIPGVTLTGLGALACGLAFPGIPAFGAAPEAPVTKAATAITGTTASLHGELNPKASGTAGYKFAYNTNGTCIEGLTSVPGAEQTGQAIKVSTPLTGLEARTPYTFCVVATRSEGEVTELTAGLPLTFETRAAKPLVASESSSAVTPFAATLEAQVNPENQATTSCNLEYGLTMAYEAGSAPCEPSSINGASEQRVSATVSGLQAATIYHYRVGVTNATGETKGADGEFTASPAEPPIVASESSSGVTSTGATLEAQINPNYQETTYAFTYATNEALTGATTVAGASPLAGEFAELPVSAITGVLQPRTTYYYRVAATNATGTTEAAAVEHFTTLAAPIVTTGEASSITRTGAVLSGTVNPGGAETTYHLAYVAAAEYEPLAANPYARGGSTSSGSVASDYTSHAVGPLGVSELHPGVTYHYAMVASNSVGTTIGPDMTFSNSPSAPPVAVTGEAIAVTQLSATLTGAVDTQGLQTNLEFEFGTSPTPGSGSLEVASVIPGSESGSTVGIATVFGGYLQSGTTYYFRAVATNQDGTSYGMEKSFTTASFPGLPAVSSVPIILFPAFSVLAAREAHENTNAVHSKHLTKTQKLARDLKACTKEPKKQRARCRRNARNRYQKTQRRIGTKR